jgi:hypothetical protein
MAAMIVNTACPSGDPVSICSRSETDSTPTPRCRNRSSASTRCRTERPKRSNAATTTTGWFYALR